MKNKIIVLQGCPCSGKSTWTKNFISEVCEPDAWVVINRDTIRYEIGKGKYTMDHESEVNVKENEMLISAVNWKQNIIIDATNLNSKTINRWKKFAEEYNYDIEFKEFYIPFTEAMKRSKQRKTEGGLYINSKVMLGFYERYYPERLKEEFTDKRVICEYVEGLPDAVICDLDGTLALHQGRQPFDWSRVSEDKIDTRLMLILNAYMEMGVQILFVTGRTESAREATEKWLSSQRLGTDWTLYMRRNNDFSHGDDFKRKIFNDNIENRYNVLCAFEDSNKCVEMYRGLGILCCQVENSDY